MIWHISNLLTHHVIIYDYATVDNYIIHINSATLINHANWSV